MNIDKSIDDNMEMNEPDSSYGAMFGKKVKVFNSWEEAEEAAIAATLLQTPEERIRETVALILRTYGVTQEELNARRKKLHIKIHRGQ